MTLFNTVLENNTIINHLVDGLCVLDVSQCIETAAILVVNTAKKFSNAGKFKNTITFTSFHVPFHHVIFTACYHYLFIVTMPIAAGAMALALY
jgi:hypothetical protein